MQFSIVARQGKAVVVEWQDPLGVHRSILPAEQVSGADDLTYDQLTAGIPYGVLWESLDIGSGMPSRIAQDLRRRGIWTLLDLQRNLGQARAALAAVYAEDLKRLIDGARRAAGG